MRVTRFVLLIGMLFSFSTIKAQIGIGTNNPHSSAMLHVDANNKGILFPRMTSVQRIAIPPVNGLIVFDTDSSTLYIYQEPIGWKQIKALATLKDLIPGNSVGDLLMWDGSQWVVIAKSNLFSFFYRDKDGDGFGDKFFPVMAGTAPEGFVANNNDCNDNDAGLSTNTWYIDADSDGYGSSVITINACTKPTGYVSNGNDCNDNNAAVNPGAPEIPANGVDDDCDGLIDEVTAPDLPDDGFMDTNGDGIDGTESAAIFVSSIGNDANPGTKLSPKRLITAAINTAQAQGKTQVYVGDGIYSEKVILKDGISIYGGYSSSTWARSAINIATIRGVEASGRIIGMEGINITSVTTIDRLSINTSNATSISTSNYGMYCNNCTGVILKNANLNSGNGGNGVAGTSGPSGTAGNNGTAGTNGSCDGVAGFGGAGGTSVCGRTGGAGGNGGPEGSNDGNVGGTGIGGTTGGSRGIGCSGTTTCTAGPGGNGTTGANGSTGASGSGGAGGSVSGGYWVSNNGGLGTNGSHGNGGGGGGGGGGQGGALVDDGGGNGGGGGGAGGCSGTGGSFGTAGGGSFGLFLVNSTGIQLINNIITSGNGGSGGAGGARGIGGNGGSGANGAVACTGEVGRGGNGGNGGRGGDGGYGGGGAGAPSYAVYRSGTIVIVTGCILVAGSGGIGGSSGGNAGANGASGTVN